MLAYVHTCMCVYTHTEYPKPASSLQSILDVTMEQK